MKEIVKRDFAMLSSLRYYCTLAFLSLSLLVLGSCKKFVQVDPPNSALNSATVYLNASTATAAVTSIYSRMSQTGLSSGLNSLTMNLGLAADELKNYSTNQQLSQFYGNNLISTSVYFWAELYQEIYVTNSILEGLANSSSLNTQLKNQLTGEAKFMRAFLYFYGANLYGDMPLLLTTNYKANSNPVKSTHTKIYDQIISDLIDAQSQLSVDYIAQSGSPLAERTRPNKYAATALLARVYLYNGDYEKAEALASDIIENKGLYNLSSLSDVFLKNSGEAIFQLQPVTTNQNTFDAYYFVLTSAPGTGRFTVALSQDLLDAFDKGDQRMVKWVGTKTFAGKPYSYPNKYKVGQNQPLTEYLTVIRLAEVYLIRAEAKIQQGRTDDGIADLNILRKRATDPDVQVSDQLARLPNGLSKDQALEALLHERQIELFAEWGHRWFDLIRTGTIDQVMELASPKKGGSWSSYKRLLPIPKSELLQNTNLSQNAGYN